MKRPGSLIVVGFLMVLVGAVLPFLMVIRLVESTFLLNFLAYIVSVAGLFLGIIGIAMYIGNVSRRKDYHDY